MNDDQGGGVARRRGLRLPGGGQAENVLALRMVSGRVSIGRLTARAAPIPGRFAPCALASMKERRLLNATNVAIKNVGIQRK